MKKMIIWILAAALLVAMLGLYGCSKAGVEATEPSESTGITAPTENTKGNQQTEATEAAAPGDTETDATDGSQPQESGSQDEDKGGSTGGNEQKPGSDSKPSGSSGSGSGNGSGSSGGAPAATTPPATNPPATEPPVTQPPVTEHTHSYSVTRTVPASCSSEGSNTYTCSCGDSYTESIPMTAHNWVHHHQDEVKHQEGGCRCVCGAKFATTAEWGAHVDSFSNLEALTNHGSNSSYTEWVIDTPAKDWDECSICGATK